MLAVLTEQRGRRPVVIGHLRIYLAKRRWWIQGWFEAGVHSHASPFLKDLKGPKTLPIQR